MKGVEEQVKELLSSVQEAVQEAEQELVAEEGVLVQELELEQVEVQVLELVEEAVAGERARELVVEPVLVQVEVEEREVVGQYCLEWGLSLRLWFRSSKGERYNGTDTHLLSQF